MQDYSDIKIAVDFDGTIVDHEYPKIGKEKLFAFQTLKQLEKRGARLILWTFRTGKELEEAVEYCRKKGIEFYAVNCNYPGEIFDENISRKIDADIYIDDKNVGGFPGWGEVWQLIFPYEIEQKAAEERLNSASGNLFKRLFRRKKIKDEN
jgi:hydroxymethylpyrimidine pyrophosphatase-like HAD family hydrolase